MCTIFNKGELIKKENNIKLHELKINSSFQIYKYEVNMRFVFQGFRHKIVEHNHTFSHIHTYTFNSPLYLYLPL